VKAAYSLESKRPTMEPTTNKPVGLIGIGLLGSAIAHRLIRAGFTVWGHDISPKAMSAFSLRGGKPIVQIGDVPMAGSPVVLSLPNPDAVENVLVSIIPRLKPGTILIDTTTGDPNRTQDLAQRLADAGIVLVDASVVGSSTIARDGNALLLVGGALLTIKECRPILEAISTRIHHVGQVGSGQKMKLITDLIQGLNQAALAEGLHLAGKMAVDPYAVLEILQSSAAYSRVMDAKGLRMIDEVFDPQTRLSQQGTDVRQILQVAKGFEAMLPLSETHASLLMAAESAGYGELDNAAIIKAWEHPAPSRAHGSGDDA
jgi:2-hydroxy-3-oxopropionate reductase